MIKYPASIDTSLELPTVIDNVTPINAALLNNVRDAILAMENELGIKPSGIYTNVRTRIAAIEVTVGNLQIISLAQDLGGTLALPKVVGLQGTSISSIVPTINQGLVFNGIAWAPANLASGTLAFTATGDLAGTELLQTVIGLQGRALAATAPTDGDAVVWDAGGSTWKPGTIISFTAGGDLTGSNTSQQVVSLTGSAGVVTIPAADLSIGSTPATAGAIRLQNGDSIYGHDGASGKVAICGVGAGGNLFFGSDTSSSTYDVNFTYLTCGSGGNVTFRAGGWVGMQVNLSTIDVANPIVGYTPASSPYGVHGVGTQAMADANQTPASSVYCFNTIVTTGAITADRDLILPAATDAAGYTKIINNTCTGSFSIIVGTGAGTTAIVANGSSTIVLIDSRGATAMTSTGNAGPPKYELSIMSGILTTTSNTFVRAGARKIDLTDYPASIGPLNRVVQFIADVDKTSGATNVEVKLYDTTHTVDVTGTDLTSTSNTNAVVLVTVTVGSSSGDLRDDVASQYELQYKMNGGGGGDAVTITNARLVITYA